MSARRPLVSLRHEGELMLQPVGGFPHPRAPPIVCGRLGAEVLFAQVVHENDTRMDWSVAQAIGRAKVLVHVDDVAAAREILQRSSAGDYAEGLEVEFGGVE